MTPLVQFVLAGIGTYLIRVSSIAVAGQRPPPSEHTTAVLRLIAPAVLAAIVVDQMFVAGGDIDIRLDWLAAGIAAGAAALRWRSAGVTMAVGMAVVWAVSAVL